MIASKISVDHPQRVEKLVIVTSGNTAPRLGDERDKVWMQASQDAYKWEVAASSEQAFIDNFKRGMLYHPERIDDDMLGANYREAKRSGNMRNYLNLPPGESDPELYYGLAPQHIHPQFPHSKVESLLIWAKDDPTVPVERGLLLMEMIPNVEMHIFNQAKHMVMTDASAGFNRLISGLR